MFNDAQQLEYSAIVAKTWIDEAFKKKLLANPRAVLAEYGIKIPESIALTVKEGTTDGKFEMALPPRPSSISDEDIRRLIVQPDACI